jgi:hypothetical protein
MTRDCGNGELVPIRFEVCSCFGPSDNESHKAFAHLADALAYFTTLKTTLQAVRCSNVRLYATDKKGYSNCIRSWTLDFHGVIFEKDRLSEL